MIYRLRKKFILISAVAVSIVFVLILAIIYFATTIQLNRTMDILTDIISVNGGIFPDFSQTETPSLPDSSRKENFFNPETKFSTRFFTVYADANNQITHENTDKISSVSRETARKYAEKALNSNSERGWIESYRYKISSDKDSKTIVFVNGETNRGMTRRLLYTVFFVLVISFFAILLLIIFISRQAVNPAAEAYEKQKQFVTDANHELKTPLTLILSNVDILKSEIGENEWLEDIYSEGKHMNALINQLVTLSRMDEDASNLNIAEFDLSAVALDMVSEFERLATEKNKTMIVSIEQGIIYSGDEGLICQLISILLDNAIKYCDTNGEILFDLHEKGHCFVIIAENTYNDVDNVELNKLFDRFYRVDKARSFTGSFGIGLSIAKSITRKHNGSIIAYRKDKNHIGFKVTLKKV